MPIDWIELQKELYPIKDYAALSKRWREAFAYPFVQAAYNFTLPAMIDYTHRLLGEDARQRYTGYEQALVGAFQRLHLAGVQDIRQLVERVDTPQQFEQFVNGASLPAREVIGALKYLAYWFIPMKKPLSGLLTKDLPHYPALPALRSQGISTNLELLQRGLTPAARQALAERSGLAIEVVTGLVNLVDFSRLPWASKATLRNLYGAGCPSLQALANADPRQLYQDFERYGVSIGKNLKIGNEIDSSYRVAQIIPIVLE